MVVGDLAVRAIMEVLVLQQYFSWTGQCSSCSGNHDDAEALLHKCFDLHEKWHIFEHDAILLKMIQKSGPAEKG